MKTLGELIDQLRGGQEPWAYPEIVLAEFDGLLSDLETGVPLSELEHHRDNLILLLRSYPLKGRSGPQFGLARHYVIGVFEIGLRDYLAASRRQRARNDIRGQLHLGALAVVRRKHPELASTLARLPPGPIETVKTGEKERAVERVEVWYDNQARRMMQLAWEWRGHNPNSLRKALEVAGADPFP